MVINLEVMIIHPHWMPTANRYLDQPLPQPWHGKNALGNHLPKVRQAEIAGWFQ
jgi:hypothetical protein